MSQRETILVTGASSGVGRAILARMVPRDHGAIVQVGSAMAYRGIPLQAPYCGAKHAVKGFTESVRTELRHRRSRVRIAMVQLPGLNTPQFEHCRSKFAKHPRPVPPVDQPEVAAEVVHWAAHHQRPESYVGLSAVYTILGTKVASGLVDAYLARTGVRSQLLDESPSDENQPGNLFDPPDRDPQAQGRFGHHAHRRSLQRWLSAHRGVVAGAAATTLAVSGLLKR